MTKGDFVVYNSKKHEIRSVYAPMRKNGWRVVFVGCENSVSIKKVTDLFGNKLNPDEMISTGNDRTKDLTGKKAGRLTVIGIHHKNKRNEVYWNCVCECGGTTIARSNNLKTGHTNSCGCYQRDKQIESVTTHGLTSGGEIHECYNIWLSMKDRCNNPNNPGYKNYGGRGISVCKEWADSFEKFIADVGERPSPKHSIDRYPDTNGNYEPSNFRWATAHQQSRNIRRNVWKEYNGVRMIVADWGKHLKVNTSLIYHHLNNGKSFDYIVNHFLTKNNISWTSIESAFGPAALET